MGRGLSARPPALPTTAAEISVAEQVGSLLVPVLDCVRGLSHDPRCLLMRSEALDEGPECTCGLDDDESLLLEIAEWCETPASPPLADVPGGSRIEDRALLAVEFLHRRLGWHLDEGKGCTAQACACPIPEAVQALRRIHQLLRDRPR